MRHSFKFKLKTFALFVFFLCVAQFVRADSYRYIDDSGNIFFVDDVSRVPMRYRSQVVKPTPVPYMSERQRRAFNREQEKIAIQKQRAEMREKKQTQKKGKNRRDASMITIFTSPTCLDCLKLEKYLRSNKVVFSKMDVVKDQNAFEVFSQMNMGTELPVTKIGSKVIKGYFPELILDTATQLGLVGPVVAK